MCELCTLIEKDEDNPVTVTREGDVVTITMPVVDFRELGMAGALAGALINRHRAEVVELIAEARKGANVEGDSELPPQIEAIAEAMMVLTWLRRFMDVCDAATLSWIDADVPADVTQNGRG
jgi:hypothetical protein